MKVRKQNLQYKSNLNSGNVREQFNMKIQRKFSPTDNELAQHGNLTRILPIKTNPFIDGKPTLVLEIFIYRNFSRYLVVKRAIDELFG